MLNFLANVVSRVFNFCDDVLIGEKMEDIQEMARKKKTDDKVGFEKPKLEETKEYQEGMAAFSSGLVGDCCCYASENGNSEKRTRFWNGYYAKRIEKYLGTPMVTPIVTECVGA